MSSTSSGLYLTTYADEETIVLVCPACPISECGIASWNGPDIDLPVTEVARVAQDHASTHHRKEPK